MMRGSDGEVAVVYHFTCHSYQELENALSSLFSSSLCFTSVSRDDIRDSHTCTTLCAGDLHNAGSEMEGVLTSTELASRRPVCTQTCTPLSCDVAKHETMFLKLETSCHSFCLVRDTKDDWHERHEGPTTGTRDMGLVYSLLHFSSFCSSISSIFRDGVL